MNKGEKYEPDYCSIMGTFRFVRLKDSKLSLMWTGTSAVEMRDWCKDATAEEIDVAASKEEYS